MPTEIKEKFGSSTAITLPATGLEYTTGTTGVQSTAVDNSSFLYNDALVTVNATTGSAALATGVIEVYAYASMDGTTYTDGGAAVTAYPVTGTSGAVVLPSPHNCRLLGIINANIASKPFISAPMSVANAFGGVLPVKWGIIVLNKTSTTAGTTGQISSVSAAYVGVTSQAVTV
jgi:hypothetical protein